MMRRDLFCAALAAPVVAVGAAAPVMAVVTEDPIMPIFREWVSARREWCSYSELPENGNWDMPESKAAAAREDAAFRAMLDMTPTSVAGIAALATVLWDIEGPVVDEEWAPEEFLDAANDPSQKLIRAIYRAASGTDDFPLKGRMAEARALVGKA